MNSSSNEDQEGNNKTEQKAGNEENTHEIEELLKSQRPKITLTDFLAILNAVIGFIVALATVGAFAVYSGHTIIRDVVLVICIVLLLLVPASAVWYVRALTPKRSTEGAGKRNLLERLAASPIGPTLLRVSNSRAFRIANFGFTVDMLTFAIVRVFPAHPQLALAVISLYTTALSGLLATEIAHSMAAPLAKDFDALSKHSDRIVGVLEAQMDVNKRLSAGHNRLVDNLAEEWIRNEKHKMRIAAVFDATSAAINSLGARDDAALDAIRATNELIRVVAGIPDPDKSDAQPEEPPDNAEKDDETPGEE